MIYNTPFNKHSTHLWTSQMRLTWSVPVCAGIVMSPDECPICNELFQLNTASRQALCLGCGHSACRSCLSRIRSPHCPTCRAPITNNITKMAPNYQLHEALDARSSISVSTSVSFDGFSVFRSKIDFFENGIRLVSTVLCTKREKLNFRTGSRPTPALLGFFGESEEGRQLKIG